MEPGLQDSTAYRPIKSLDSPGLQDRTDRRPIKSLESPGRNTGADALQQHLEPPVGLLLSAGRVVAVAAGEGVAVRLLQAHPAEVVPAAAARLLAHHGDAGAVLGDHPLAVRARLKAVLDVVHLCRQTGMVGCILIENAV